MTRFPLLAGALILLSAVSANAQSAPSAPAPAGNPEPAAAEAPDGGRGGFRGMHHRPFEMMHKAAGFRFKRDGAEIDIRCATNEPTRACVDAASVLIDKVATMKAAP
jgi:hypothetical protein